MVLFFVNGIPNYTHTPRMVRVVAAGVWWVRGRARVVPEGGQHTRCVRRAAAGGAPALSSFKKYAQRCVGPGVSRRRCPCARGELGSLSRSVGRPGGVRRCLRRAAAVVAAPVASMLIKKSLLCLKTVADGFY